MPAHSKFPEVDKALHGRTVAKLRGYRKRGFSYERIAREISRDAGVDVSSTTVKTWCEEKLDGPPPS